MNQKGFTLIEILVALVLASLLFVFAPSFSTSDRDNADNLFNAIERNIRYAKDQAVLENKITRVHFKLDENPQTFTIEIANSNSLLLPEEKEREVKSISQTKEDKREQETFNNAFSPLPDLEGESEKVQGQLKLLGVGSALDRTFKAEGSGYVYFYPNGESDGAFFLVALEKEIGSLSMAPFTTDFERLYEPIESPLDMENPEEILALTSRYFTQWLNKK